MRLYNTSTSRTACVCAGKVGSERRFSGHLPGLVEGDRGDVDTAVLGVCAGEG